VYFAKDGNTSLGSYAQGGITWKNSQLYPQSCAALAEIVNLPEKFVSNNPYYVVADTTWISWCVSSAAHCSDGSIHILDSRYLLVSNKSGASAYAPNNATTATTPSDEAIPMVPMDPLRRVTLGGKNISIPSPEYKLEKIRTDRENEYMEEDLDEDDASLFVDPAPTGSQPGAVAFNESEEPTRPVVRPADDWKHDPKWVRETITHTMPAPVDSTRMATMSLQRELNSMLKEQERATSLGELGWYMPPEFIEDNLYQWIVEVHSFDKELPIAKDLVQRKVNSLVFEIRFPPSFPHSPPFFRILKPRFLPFIHVRLFSSTHLRGGEC
jgi:ubiquitin-conjugating enzyme E2 Q